MTRPTHPVQDHPRAWLAFALLLLGLAAALALWASTPYGLGLVNDTASYVGGADNLLRGCFGPLASGNDEIKPITHFPPLFSLLLAGLGLTGLNLLAAGKLAVVALFGANVALTGALAYRVSRSPGAALLAALLLAASDLLLEVHAYLLSEPLFLALMLLAMLGFVDYYETRAPGKLALAGLALSAAYLTRYAAISLVAAAVAAVILLWLARPGEYEVRRFPARALAGMLAAVIIGYLLAGTYTFSASGELGNRSLAWHPISSAQLLDMHKNLLSWLAPDDLLLALPIAGQALSLVSLLVVPGLLAFAGYNLWRLYRRAKPARVTPALAGALLLALHVLFYLAFLVISISLFDASTPLNARILAPAFVALIILFAAGLAWLWQRAGKALWRALIALAVVALALFTLKDGWDESRYLRQDGLGFANRGWSESPAIAAIKTLPDVTLYSDRPAALYLLAGRNAYVALSPIDPVTMQPRADYQQALEEMQSAVREGRAMLVLFSEPGEAQSFAALTSGLPLVADYGNVIIYGMKK
jgi:hypothetical protein